jgi:lipoprotein-releasing system ATP-binding protein
MDEYLIRASELRKRYSITRHQTLDVLKGITIDISPRETIAVIGPSGAGKSTLLHILGGLDRPDEGAVFYGNENIFQYPDEILARFRNTRLGFVFQFHHLLPEFTAIENVMMPGLIGGESRGKCRKKAAELLDRVGLSERSEHFPSEMSGGEQQRVAVARALLNDPEILFADEPSGNLDRAGGERLHELLWKLNDEIGITLFIVTHNLDLADRADRIIHIVDGKIANIGDEYSKKNFM